jgi:hypothetical protein
MHSSTGLEPQVLDPGKPTLCGSAHWITIGAKNCQKSGRAAPATNMQQCNKSLVGQATKHASLAILDHDDPNYS